MGRMAIAPASARSRSVRAAMMSISFPGSKLELGGSG